MARRSALGRTAPTLSIALALLIAPVEGVLTDVGSDDPKPFLVALDRRSGHERWRSIAEGPGVRRVVGEARRLVYVYDTKCVRGTGGPARIVAIDSRTGRRQWTEPVVYYPPPTEQFSVAGDTIVVVGRDSHLRGLDPKTGRNRWESALDGSVPLAGSGDLVLLAQDHWNSGVLHAIDRRTGDLTWTFTHPLAGSLDVFRVTVVDDDTAVIKYSGRDGSGGSVGGQVAVDLATGQQLWEQPRDRELKTGPSWGLVFEFTPPFGPVNARDPQSKQSRWSTPLRANDIAGADARVVVALTSNSVEQVALDARTGRRLWDSAAGGKITVSDALIINTSQVGSHERADMIARDARTGRIRWSERAPLGGGKSWFVGRNVYVTGGCVGVDET